MLNLLQMFVSEGKMPIAGLIVILYVVFAEWRIAKMKNAGSVVCPAWPKCKKTKRSGIPAFCRRLMRFACLRMQTESI